MYLVDYHTHSHNSFDGYLPVDVIAQLAITRGIKELCITDHYECSDLHTPMEPTFKKSRFEILEAREKYGDKIKLLYGIELGQMHFEPELCKEFISKNDFDFIIGSMHNLRGDRDIYYVQFDKFNSPKILEEYLLELLELSKSADYNVIGHITYPMRYIVRDGEYIDIANYRDIIDEILKAVISRGRGIEVNASGLVHLLGDTIPPYSIVKRYRELGGEIITVGSDAHRQKNVGWHIDDAMEMIKRAGFEYITTFEKRKPSFIKIDD